MADCKIMIIGLGEVAQTHLKVLEGLPGIAVVAGIDPVYDSAFQFKGQSIPVYEKLADAKDGQLPDIVVIATPTSSHAAVSDEAARRFPLARILIEKPAADNFADARRMLSGRGSRQQIDVAYHMSFSPEVMWGSEIVKQRAGHLGVPVSAQAFFMDPYELGFESAHSRFGNSWVDSGINSLSVLSRFAAVKNLESLRAIDDGHRSMYEAHVTCQGKDDLFDALIFTSWHVSDPTRSTRIRYGSGAELFLDHQAVAGCLTEHGKITGFFGSDGTVPRRESHYRALYKWWLVENRQIMDPQYSLHLHEILFGIADAA